MAEAVYLFDAYGTLFDVHSAVRRHAGGIGAEAERLSALWRAKQLEYSWVRSLMGRYRDFWALTEEALDYALASCGVDASFRPGLLDAYRSLDCYPEVPAVLDTLRRRGARLAILSNGSPDMLQAALRASGLADLFDAVLSADEAQCYKTGAAVYELATTRFRLYPEAISFQSSNRWDVAGATAFGFRTIWINRSGAPDEYPDLPPSATLASLSGLEAV
ncbi:haloacid dehalogenase type II [Propylenella binzhouense]|uniref:(S)-2-haloacid dehalogenase n=1 Tax=Propylenella binzhouense TaxID=2555902 RepID=A0A964T5R2_9HYPH|nr:haloacid dehalogenase type II [Propylenella binzhouense]MYZ48392.1 haloacid dehalogenase type II [Propylenella binzhouense]